MPKAKTADVRLANLGTIWTFYANTRAGEKWIAKHLRGETICEHAYGFDIARGMLKAGLVLEDAATGRRAIGPAIES